MVRWLHQKLTSDTFYWILAKIDLLTIFLGLQKWDEKSILVNRKLFLVRKIPAANKQVKHE